jgi:hypothetical protein
MRLYLIVYPTGAQDEVHLPVGLRQQRLRQLELQERDEEKHQQGRIEGNHSGQSVAYRCFSGVVFKTLNYS